MRHWYTRFAIHGAFGLLVVFGGVPAWSSHDLLRPTGITYVTPGDTVPEECARFFSPTGWGEGAWDGGRPHELHITNVEADCTATVLYGYGGWKHDGTGDWFSLPGEIKRDRLIVPIPEHNAVATYEISHDALTLTGVWEKDDESATAFVLLERLD